MGIEVAGNPISLKASETSNTPIIKIIESVKAFDVHEKPRIASQLAIDTLGNGIILDIWRCYDRHSIKVKTENADGITNIHLESDNNLARITFTSTNNSYGFKSIYKTAGDISIIDLGDKEILVLRSELEQQIKT